MPQNTHPPHRLVLAQIASTTREGRGPGGGGGGGRGKGAEATSKNKTKLLKNKTKQKRGATGKNQASGFYYRGPVSSIKQKPYCLPPSKKFHAQENCLNPRL